MKKSLLWSALMLCAIFVIAYGALVVNKNPSGLGHTFHSNGVQDYGSSASAGVYADPTLGITIMYPQGWGLSSTTHPLGYELAYDSHMTEVGHVEIDEKNSLSPSENNTDLQGMFGVAVFRDSEDRDLASLVQGLDPSPRTQPASTTLGGLPALEAFAFNGDFTTDQIFALRNGLVYTVYFIADNPNDTNQNAHLHVYANMLKNFRFVK